MTDIKELRRLAEAATPEQWNAESIADMPGYIGFYKEDCDYIAAANPSAILSLLDKIDAQEAIIAELHISIAGAVQHGEQGWQRYEAANKMCLNQQNEIAGLNEVIAELRKDSDIAKKKFELSLEFMSKILRFFRPITKANIWARIDKFGEEYNSKLELIDPDASTQEVG